MSAPLFRWSLWATDRPTDPYYVTNWDRRQAITVVAATKQEAIDIADAALGSAGPHRRWVFRVREVTDHRIPTDEAVTQ